MCASCGPSRGSAPQTALAKRSTCATLVTPSPTSTVSWMLAVSRTHSPESPRVTHRRKLPRCPTWLSHHSRRSCLVGPVLPLESLLRVSLKKGQQLRLHQRSPMKFLFSAPLRMCPLRGSCLGPVSLPTNDNLLCPHP